MTINNTGSTSITLKAEGAQLSLTPPKAEQEERNTEIQVPPGTGTLYVLPLQDKVKLSYQDPTGQQSRVLEDIRAQTLQAKLQIDPASLQYLFDNSQLTSTGNLPKWVSQLPTELTVRISLPPIPNAAEIFVPVSITVEREEPATPTTSGPTLNVKPKSLLLAGGGSQDVGISLQSSTGQNLPAYEIVDLRVTTAGGEEARVPIVLVHGLKEGKSALQLFEKRGDKEPVITRTGSGFPGWVAERKDDPWRLWLMEMVAFGIQGPTARCTKGEGEMRLGAQETQWCYVRGEMALHLVPDQLTLKCLAEPEENRCVVALWAKKEAHQNGF